MINSIPKARHVGQGITEPTRREHTTAGVPAALSIAGFGGGQEKRTQREFAPHPSTPLGQLVGDSARGHSVTSRKLAPVPVVANPNVTKQVRTPAVSWGHASAPNGHDPKMGDAVMCEALPCGGKPLLED